VRRARRRPNATSDPPRDQEHSAFAAILANLLRSIPSVQAAVLVDLDGETVDYAGRFDAFDLRVAAAHWRIVMSQLERGPFGPARQLVVRTRSCAYVARSLDDGYVLLLVLRAHAAFALSARALQEAERHVRLEAGWPLPVGEPRWFAARVRPSRGDRWRPASVHSDGEWRSVEILGSLLGLPPHETGFRVRLVTGAETILVRERTGRWFSDEPLCEASHD
jgi:predicted regulator of Ras-like GTPase activity (Roadblock/LC7/MglB family)